MRGRNGFTMVELLVALTILAMVLGLSLRIASAGNRTAAAVRDYAALLSVAEARLASLQASEKMAALTESGKEGDILWRDRIAPATDPVFARAKANHQIVWRLTSEAEAPDGRKVSLSASRMEASP